MLRFVIFFLSISSLSLYSQLNMEQLGELDIPTIHSTGLNDIWGYTDEEGNEYALVGAEDGVSIVDVTDPSAPVEVFWLDGMNSIWRDLKTFGDYLYVTTEAEEGMTIIDLSPLPTDTDLSVAIYDGPIGDEWLTAHNLYMDDGYVYIFGAGRGEGGVIILDVATDPMNPIEVGVFDSWYCHDGYVRDDIGYFAHIYDGFFSIVDLTDKTAPVLLGTAVTPTNFTHNIWLSDDGNYVFTTDEVSGGFIGAYDISDPFSIVEVDKIQSSPGAGIFPHNSHVLGNYLYTSYYTDGIVIHDITYPNNLIEVANYDSSPLSSPTTDGCWGVYPFLGSGNIIASDRQEGLFVYNVDEHPGSYLQGNITELGIGTPVNNVSVTIEGTTIEDNSSILGDYATGIEGEGSLDVTFFKVLYFPETISVPFENGVVIEEDIVLQRIPEFSVQINVYDSETLLPVENANVLLSHTYIDHPGITDADGMTDIPLYYQDNYQLHVGKWGYLSSCFSDTLITDELTEIDVYITKGIEDDFTFDNGWTSFGTAARGFWEREVPVEVLNGDGTVQNPGVDIGFDCGEYAYITGNGTTSSNTEEVNNGVVQLLSPVFDLTDYSDAHVNYGVWFFNRFGATPDDTLNVFLLNGLGDVVLIDQHYNGGLPMSQWHAISLRVDDFITPTANMQILFTLSDFVETENVTEGAIDYFLISNNSLASLEDSEEGDSNILIYPNPFTNQVTISGIDFAQVKVVDLTGREVADFNTDQVVDLSFLERGTYFFVISDIDNNLIEVIQQVKQ